MTKLRVTPSASASSPADWYLPSSSNRFHRCARASAHCETVKMLRTVAILNIFTHSTRERIGVAVERVVAAGVFVRRMPYLKRR